MTFTSIPDDFNDRHDLDDCTRSARLLHVELYVYANLTGRDGRIPIAKLRRLTDSDDPQRDLDELLEHDRDISMDGHVIVLDWKHQRTAARLEELAAQGRERKARWNAKKEKRERAHAAGDHDLCSPDFCPFLAGTRSETRAGTTPLPNPTTTQPDRKGGVGRSGGRSANAAPPPLGDTDRHHFVHDDTGPDCAECSLPRHNRHHVLSIETVS